MLAHVRVPLSWGEILKRTAKETLADDCLGLAAQLAYYFFLALFPALLFLVALASFFPIRDLMDAIMASLGRFAPGDVLEVLREQIQAIASGEHGGLLTLGMIGTVWSTSAGMVAIISTLNAAYDIQDSRPWWKVRLTAVLLTIALAVFVLCSFALVLAGPAMAGRVADWIGLGAAFEWTWKILQWPVIFALVATGIGIIYYSAPDAEQDWVWLTPGATLATMLWLVVSLGFKFYVANFTSYNETYGAIGAVIVLMLWFYLSGLAILIGAEMNAEIEHASPYGKDPGEKAPGQKKKIGVAAARAFEARRRFPDPAPIAAQANCEVDRPAVHPPARIRLRLSDLVLGGLVFAQMAISVRKRLRRA